METGRNNDDGISGRQLRELLRSLPAAHAPEDLELNLLYRIAENESYPHRSRPRIPRARVRAAASQSARRTRYDRLRGLAAAALAAFVLAGSWSIYTEPAAQLPIEPSAGRSLDLSPQVEESPAEAMNERTESRKPATAVEKEKAAVVGVERAEQNNTVVTSATTAPSTVTTTQEKVSERDTPALREPVRSSPLDPAPSSTQPASTAPNMHSTPSAQTTPAADSTSPAPELPPGSSGVGTGGEPPEEIES